MARLSSSLALVLVAVLGCGGASSGPGSPGQTNLPDADVGLDADDAPALDGSAGVLDAATDQPGDVGAVPAADGPSPGSDAGAEDGRSVDGMAPAGPYLVEGLDGDVTAREVAAFITAASAAAIPTAHWTLADVASHNILSSFGRGGITLEAINRMYEVARSLRMTGEERQLLDLAIKWTDAWLIHRNDLPLGEHRVMWTGKVDPLWPPNHPADLEAAYAGSETGDTVGIAAYTALNIAATPELAEVAVSDGDPNHLGATYLARARTYLAMLEVCMDQYFLPNFIDPDTLTLHHPASPAYAIPGTPGGSQNVNAWNRMMLFMDAFQTLGQAHHLLADSPSKDTMYRKVVENTVNAFVRTPLSHAAADGTLVYDWGYGNFGDILNNRSNEDISHGQIDMIGLTRAYRGGYTDATAAQMKTFADTVVHELLISPGVYAGSVNRSKAKEMAPALPAGWLLLSPYNPDVYPALARDMIAAGRQPRDAGVTATILWAKHWTAAGPFPAP